jgi:hypothetical protein
MAYEAMFATDCGGRKRRRRGDEDWIWQGSREREI